MRVKETIYMKENKPVSDIKSLSEILNSPELPHERKKSKIEFFPLTVSLLAKITPMLGESNNMLCDYTPGGLLFGMRRLYSPTVCVCEDKLFLSVLSDDRTHRDYLMPVGGDIAESLELLDRYTREHNLPFSIHTTQKYAELAARYFRCGYEISDELCDYVYNAHDLALLEGAKYHTQRTNIRKLQREHESWSYVRINDKNLADAVAFADALFAGQTGDGSRFWQAGVDIVYDALYNLEALSLRSGMLYVDGKTAGIAIGYVKQEMLYIHVLRANREIWGAWNLLCREFVADNLEGVRYVNMEDDLGEEGVRRMKMSYCPIEYIKRARADIR